MTNKDSSINHKHKQHNHHDKTIFTHEFSGLSVWMEPNDNSNNSRPCPVERIKETIVKLAHECGGSVKGVHPFEPHVTLLYNMTVQDVLKRASQLQVNGTTTNNKNELDNNTDEDESNHDMNENHDDDDHDVIQKASLVLLKQCIKQLTSSSSSTHLQSSSSAVVPKVKPTSLYYFPYPREASNGNGFGSLILLLLIEKTEWLLRLHQVVRGVFPLDQRHAAAAADSLSSCPTSSHEEEEEDPSSNDNIDKNETNNHHEHGRKTGREGKRSMLTFSASLSSLSNTTFVDTMKKRKHNDDHHDNDNDDENDNTTTFRPHLSLVYAPESQTWLKKCVPNDDDDDVPQTNGIANGMYNDKEKEEEEENNRKDMQRVANVMPPPPRESFGGNDVDSHDAGQQHLDNHGQQQHKQLLAPLPMALLSVWSTRGTVDQWYRVASVPLVAYDSEGAHTYT